MNRIATSFAAGVACLLVVSIGLCQTVPQPLPVSNEPAVLVPQPAEPAIHVLQSQGNREGKAAGLKTCGHPSTGANSAVAVSEKLVVKVYSVPDLVADIRRKPESPSDAANAEFAAAMRQMQVYIQPAQQAAVQSVPTATHEAPDGTTRKLERLKKAIRVAAPRKSWIEAGGEGEIEIYPETLSLIVRQTNSNHEAIGDLLTQLRATRNIQIELTVEVMSFDNVTDASAAETMKLLNRELSTDEVVRFRNSGMLTMSSTVRMANGQTTGAGVPLPLQITAVATADQNLIEFRIHYLLPKAEEEPILSHVLNQSHTVVPGKTIALLTGPIGDGVMLITPKIIDRSNTISK